VKSPYLRRLFLMVFGLCFGVLGLELGLRLLYPNSAVGGATKFEFEVGAYKNYQADSETGFMPKLGNGFYDEVGCLPNCYALHEAHAPRLLFVGDSVTRRGKIIEALEKAYGSKNFEYWNAGVESFNVAQELVFFRRHNAAVNPKHVILTLHNNDYLETPLVFARGGKLEIFATHRTRESINPWLFENSHSYRWISGWILSSSQRSQQRERMRADLAAFAEEASQRGAAFSVLVLPVLKDEKAWKSVELSNHLTSLELLKELKIRHFDLRLPLQKALAKGVAVEQEPGDSWHPSPEVSDYFASYLKEQQLL
jgi:hypothetical protein